MDLTETSLATFMLHIRLWQLIGLYPVEYKNSTWKFAHMCALIFFHFNWTFYHPFSLAIKVVDKEDIKGMIDNISVVSVLGGIFIKMCIVKFNSSKFTRICLISVEFQEKYKSSEFAKEQLDLFKHNSRKYFNTYLVTYAFIILFEGLKIFALPPDKLLHPGYYPFDPFSSKFLYNCVNWYQFFSWFYLGSINIFADSYPSMLIYLVKQNMKVLGKHIEEIGYNPKENAHKMLKEAIKDQHQLNELFNLTTNFLSPAMFTMFLSVFINLVFVVLLATFFTDNFVEVIFLVLFVAGTQMEISLPCYYGSEFEAASDQFLRSLYSCNWTEQSKGFKMDLIILTELCLRKKSFFAGGLFPISLETFVRIVKGAYSSYTVLSQMAG